MKRIKNLYKKIALALSIGLVILWALMGTGASLAWFTDTSEDVNNIFHFGELDIEVSVRRDDGTYEQIRQDTKVFDDEALYEPGYVQVVWLRIENRGTLDFTYKTAVSVTDYTPGVNVYGNSFDLQEYLLFGLVTAKTEAELEAKLVDRDAAVANANMELNYYTTDESLIPAGEVEYMALIVRMPEAVDNIANYRDGMIPKVELGLIFSATQLKKTGGA